MKNLKKNFLTLALTTALSLGIAAPANANDLTPQQKMYQEVLAAVEADQKANRALYEREAAQELRASQIAYEKDKAARQKKAAQVKAAQAQQVKKAPAIKKYKKKAVKKRAYKHQRKANSR